MATDTVLKIPLFPIEGSSNLTGYGYDIERRILAVQFKNARIFHYAQFSADDLGRFEAAVSKGKHYANEIKGKFPGAPVTGPCPKCGDEGYDGEKCDDCGTACYAIPPRRSA